MRPAATLPPTAATTHDGADDGSTCGVTVAVGDAMLVHAHSLESRLAMSLCSRTGRSADAAEDFGALGPPAETGTAQPTSPG